MQTVEWCKVNLAPPIIKRRKELCVMVHRTDKPVYGEYCERNNWLTINLFTCENVKDIVTTTIHEYTHFCQDLKEYAVMTKQVGYDKNPFEVEANQNEVVYYKQCWKQIKNNI